MNIIREGWKLMSKSEKFVETLYWEVWNSPFGKVTICCSERGVRRLALGSLPKMRAGEHDLHGGEIQRIRAGSRKQHGAKLARRAIAELREYAAGRRRQFTVPVDLQGTAFQLKVWNALLRIPYGETRSYKQIACQIGNPLASRAVGTANHWNPVAILVPCHRVISSDGSLGGYAGGLRKKSQMLRLEKVPTSWKRPEPTPA